MANLRLAQFISFGAITGAAVFFMIAERLWPYNRGQKVLRTGFWLDFLWYNFFQSFLLALVISWILDQAKGALSLGGGSFLSSWPVLCQVCFFIVTHDLYIYSFHRWQHHNRWLWRLHEAHHSVPEVDWLSGIRSHPFEILINQTIEYAPMILLGASPVAVLAKSAFGSIYGMFIHSNLRVRLGPLLYVFNGPELHRWHHANCDERAYNKNFATKFAFWDWLFGTVYNPPEERAISYGLNQEPFPEGRPWLLFLDGYLGQVALAFRRW
jgi:sterol desaturase/sphingolipid hydroxylase (fatty acid hydroxylase superfamily)